MPTYRAVTGDLPTITTTEQAEPPAETMPTWMTRSYRILTRGCVVLFIGGWTSALACLFLLGDESARGVLLATTVVLLVLAGVAAIAAWTNRHNSRMAHRTLLEVAQMREQQVVMAGHVSRCAGELRQIPELLRREVAALGETHVAIAREMRETVNTRLAEIDQQLDDLTEAYEHGWVNGAKATAAACGSNGQVRQLRTPPQRG